jgi:hypothetical protein
MYSLLVQFSAYVAPYFLILGLFLMTEDLEGVEVHFTYIMFIIFAGYLTIYVVIPVVWSPDGKLGLHLWRLQRSDAGEPYEFITQHNVFSHLAPIYASVFVVTLIVYIYYLYSNAPSSFSWNINIAISPTDSYIEKFLKTLLSVSILIVYPSFIRF